MSSSIENKIDRVTEQAIYTNTYHPYITESHAVGFKTQPSRTHAKTARYRLAEDFLMNLSFVPGDLEREHAIRFYLGDIGAVIQGSADQEDNALFHKERLPLAAPLRLSLETIFRQRRSYRQYTGDRIKLPYLASIVFAGGGIGHRESVSLPSGITAVHKKRQVPSAGGLYPVGLVIIVLRVEGLVPGVYQFQPEENCLVKWFDSDCIPALMACFSCTEDQISLQRAGMICLIVGNATKSMMKYGAEGLAFTLFEVGAIAQTLQLAVTALGLGAVECASFYKQKMHQLLQFDGLYQHVFHSVVIGVI